MNRSSMFIGMDKRGVILMVSCLAALGCDPNLSLNGSVAITCASQNDCPASLVCVNDIGRCLPRGSSCTEERDGGVFAASNGNACTRPDGAGTCNTGTCTRCGDGVLESGEECDDGNDDSQDGCTATCRSAVCGDGIVTSPPEDCDDGNDNDNDACAGCRRVSWDAAVAYGIGPRRGDLPTSTLRSLTAVTSDSSGLVYAATQVDDSVGTVGVPLGVLWSISEASQVIARVAGVVASSGSPPPLRETQVARDTAIAPITGIARGEGDVIYLALSGLTMRHIVAIDQGVMRIVAGSGAQCTAALNAQCGDDGPARVALLREPGALAFDGGGILYFADGPSIRAISRDGTLRTVAGDGTPCLTGPCGDGSPALDATFGRITGLSFDARNDLYVSDADQGRLRRIGATFPGARPATVERLRDVPQASGVVALPTGLIYASAVDGFGARIFDPGGDRPFLGDGVACNDPICGDDGPAATALARTVVALAAEPTGSILIADTGLEAVRRVSNGVVRRVAGGRAPPVLSNALATSQGLPGTAIAPLPGGDFVFASETLVFRYRAARGELEHLAGAGEECRVRKCAVEGAAREVGFTGIADVATSQETVFIADAKARRVLELADGVVRVVAGDGEPCAMEPCPDVSDARQLSLTNPRGLAVDATALYVGSNHSVWRIDRATGGAARVAGSTSGFADSATPRDALFSCALDVAIADDGALIVADFENCALRRIDAAGVSTLVRDDPASCATLAFPTECGGRISSFCTAMLLPTALDVRGTSLVLANDCGSAVEELTLAAPSTRVRLAGGGTSDLESALAAELVINRPRFAYTPSEQLVVMDTDVTASRVWSIDASTGRANTIVGDVDGGITGDAPLVELGPIVGAAGDSAGTLFWLDAGYGRVRRAEGGTRVETVVGHRYGVALASPAAGGPPQGTSRFISPLARGSGIAFAPLAAALFVSERDVLLKTTLVGDDARDWVTYAFPAQGAWPVSIELGALAIAPDEETLYATDAARHIVYAIAVGEMEQIAYANATVFAGREGFVGSQGDGGPAIAAALDTPSALAVSASGAVYIADAQAHRVRRVADGIITTVLGTGLASNASDGRPALTKPVDSPQGLAFDAFGNLVVVGRDAVRLVFSDSATCGEPCGDSTVETIYRGAERPAQRDLATCLAAPVRGITAEVIEVGDACSGAVLRLSRQAPR